MIAIILLIGINASAQQVYKARQNTSDQYDILFIRTSGDGDSYGAFRAPDASSGNAVHQGKNAKKVIEQAISKARITVLKQGEFVTGAEYGIEITEDEKSLIVGPDATVLGTGEHEYHLMIRVTMSDHVNVFNLGTINTGNIEDDESGRAVEYDGNLGKKGASGVKGGIMFGSGQIKNVSGGYWAVDAENMTMPLLWTESHMNASVAMEGVENSEIGVIGQLALGEGQGEGETIDMNMSCKRIHIGHVIGLAPKPGDEIVDINNGHHVTVDRLTAFQGAGYDGALLVGYDRYGHSGMHSNRPKLQRQRGHIIKWTERIRKEVKRFHREVSYPGFPDDLPTLRVNARLVAEFEDGSEQEIVNKKYEFDL